MRSIPIIDISALDQESSSALRQVGDAICEAAQKEGFFYIVGRQIDTHLTDSVFEVAKTFFDLPEHKKSQVAAVDTHRGFLRRGEATMQGYASADIKESFIWGLEQQMASDSNTPDSVMLAPNRWHSELPGMRVVLNQYFQGMHRLAASLLRAIAISLDRCDDYFTRFFNRPVSRGALIYYPGSETRNGGYGVSPHTDFGCLSLLAQRSAGLQVELTGGEWAEVEPLADSYVVNVGDLMSRWTNGLFRSVPHCVVNTSGSARYSAVVFVDPDSQTLINPILNADDERRYEPISCETYIAKRFDRSFAYRQ